MKPPLPVTGSTQHLSAQLWDTNTWPRGPQSLFEQGTCFKCKCFWDWEAWEQWSSLGGRGKLYGERQDVVRGLPQLSQNSFFDSRCLSSLWAVS